MGAGHWPPHQIGGRASGRNQPPEIAGITALLATTAMLAMVFSVRVCACARRGRGSDCGGGGGAGGRAARADAGDQAEPHRQQRARRDRDQARSPRPAAWRAERRRAKCSNSCANSAEIRWSGAFAMRCTRRRRWRSSSAAPSWRRSTASRRWARPVAVLLRAAGAGRRPGQRGRASVDDGVPGAECAARSAPTARPGAMDVHCRNAAKSATSRAGR
jgi:hypothetical protein